MSREDLIKDDIKIIFDEETSEMEFTDKMMESVLDKTTRSGKGKIRRILNPDTCSCGCGSNFCSLNPTGGNPGEAIQINRN